MGPDIEEKELTRQLQQITALLNEEKGEEAWQLIEPLYEKKDLFCPERTIDIINAAGCAKFLLFFVQESKQLLEEGLNRSIAAKYAFGEAFARCFLSSILRSMSKLKPALEHADRAKTLFEESKSLLGESEDNLLLGQIYIELGLSYHDLGQLQNAKTFMEKALRIHREFDNRPGLYRVLQALYNRYYIFGDFEKAHQLAQEAADIAKELNDELKIIDSMVLIGVILKRQGRLHEAELHFKGLDQKLKEINDSRPITNNLQRSLDYNLGHTLVLLGRHEEARELFLKLLQIEQQDKHYFDLTGSQGLGLLALSLGDYEKATKYLETVLTTMRSAKPNSTAFVEELITLSTVYVELGEYEKAQTFLEEARQIQTESKYTAVFVSFGDGVLAQAKRNLELASKSFHKSLKLATEMGLSEYIIRALFRLATLEFFEYRISGNRVSLGKMRDLLQEAQQKATDSQMPLLALEIGILSSVACTANMEYDCAMLGFEQCESLAQQLGLSRKLEEIKALIQDLREKRTQAAEVAIPEYSLADTQKISEYVDNVHKIIRTFSEGRSTG
ncbi:MAG: tetratricopeptide repeat protein [Candidatus Hodarchaeota archaeon]